MDDFTIIKSGRISGQFNGFNENKLFKLTDGSFWLQKEYRYWYHYIYNPVVLIIEYQGDIYLKLEDHDEMVRVKQIHGVIESNINGAFNGWHGHSKYKLNNGQVWEQVVYKYEYSYSYCPHVLIYGTSNGIVMDVEGSSAIVRKI